MAVPKKRQTRSRKNKRSANIHLKMPHIVKCTSCSAYRASHCACNSCGYYRNMKVI